MKPKIQKPKKKKKDLTQNNCNFTMWFNKKNKNFRDLRVLDVVLYLKLKSFRLLQILIASIALSVGKVIIFIEFKIIDRIC